MCEACVFGREADEDVLQGLVTNTKIKGKAKGRCDVALYRQSEVESDDFLCGQCATGDTPQQKTSHQGDGVVLDRGEEIGEFKLGSTIVLLFQAPSTFQWSVVSNATLHHKDENPCICISAHNKDRVRRQSFPQVDCSVLLANVVNAYVCLTTSVDAYVIDSLSMLRLISVRTDCS